MIAKTVDEAIRRIKDYLSVHQKVELIRRRTACKHHSLPVPTIVRTGRL